MQMKSKKAEKRKYNLHSYGTLYFFALPGVLYLLINNCLPIVIGWIVAFKNVNFTVGIFKSEWNGFRNFEYLFKTTDALVITRNTIFYNLAFIAIGTTVAVFVALLLSEVINKRLFSYFQGIILFPHLISMVIVSYLVFAFLSIEHGFVNHSILRPLGLDFIAWYSEPEYWPSILLFINTWKTFGFLSIIFYAAIIAIDPTLYDAASVDGTGRVKQVWYITLPLIKPTIIVMVLMKLGKIFYADFGLFFQVPMDSGALYQVTNVIDTYVYRALLKSGNIGMAASACLYQSFVGFIVFIIANRIVKKMSPENSLF